MTEAQKMQLLVLHTGCVLVICLCFALAELSPLHDVVMFSTPLLSRALEVAGFFLWGKLGFKPADPVLDKIIASMEPARVEQIMSQRPPPPELPKRSMVPTIFKDRQSKLKPPPPAGGA
jgi:hypothetical protein